MNTIITSKKYTAYESIQLLDYYFLLCKNNNQNLIISKKNDTIILFNNNLKITISKEEFLDKFSSESFYIFKPISEETEINIEFKKLRQ